MNFFKKFVQKIQQIKKATVQLKSFSNDVKAVNRNLDSMRRKSNPGALEEVKITSKRVFPRETSSNEGHSTGTSPFGEG